MDLIYYNVSRHDDIMPLQKVGCLYSSTSWAFSCTHGPRNSLSLNPGSNSWFKGRLAVANDTISPLTFLFKVAASALKLSDVPVANVRLGGITRGEMGLRSTSWVYIIARVDAR